MIEDEIELDGAHWRRANHPPGRGAVSVGIHLSSERTGLLTMKGSTAGQLLGSLLPGLEGKKAPNEPVGLELKNAHVRVWEMVMEYESQPCLGGLTHETVPRGNEAALPGVTRQLALAFLNCPVTAKGDLPPTQGKVEVAFDQPPARKRNVIEGVQDPEK